MRIVPAILICCTVAGCAQQPKTLWLRADGQRSNGDPVLNQQFQLDRTMCLGEREKADLSGVTIAQGGFAGYAAAQQRGQAADAVGQGCMAQKGYVLVREEEADARQQEFAAVAAEKKQRELAAAAPPAAQTKRKPATAAQPVPTQ
jgi:hypothetical protein